MLRSALFALLLLLIPAAQAQDVATELDAYWAEVTRTVEQGDFEGYAALYHPDAVLVFAGQGTTMPVSGALAGWKDGFEQTKAGAISATVSFRFSRRLNSATTAHETGIFNYVTEGTDGKGGAMVHFTAMLVKKDGQWLMVLEDQEQMATQEDWDALAAGN